MTHLVDMAQSESGCMVAHCICGWFVYGHDHSQVLRDTMEHLNQEHRTVEVEL